MNFKLQKHKHLFKKNLEPLWDTGVPAYCLTPAVTTSAGEHFVLILKAVIGKYIFCL